MIQRRGAIGGFVNAVPEPSSERAPRHLATALAGSDDRLRRGADSGGWQNEVLACRGTVSADRPDLSSDGTDEREPER